MKKIIAANIISNLIWMITIAIGVIGTALFIDTKPKENK
jgi:hypothetical protein